MSQLDNTPLTLAPGDLADHPLLAHIPVWPRDSEEFKSLRESVRDDGQLYEVLIDASNRVLDGRNRRNACAALNRPVRCRRVAEAEAVPVVFRSLMQRRHFSKGARAFLAVPLVLPLINAAKERKLGCLRRGESPVSDSIGDGVPTVAQVALDVGVSVDVLDQARRLHDLLAGAPPELAADLTARVIDGEMGLGYACTALANAARDQAKTRLDKRAQHDRLFGGYLPKLGLHWTEASAEQRGQIAEALRTQTAHWPVELLEETQAAVRAALKRAKETQG